MGKLTKHQVMRGDKEAMMGDDRAGVALQQFVCVRFVKVLIVQTSLHGDFCGDSGGTKSRVGYMLGDTQRGNRLAVACSTRSPFRLLYLRQMCPQGTPSHS